MALTRWDPFRDLISLREAMDRLFEESFVRPRTGLVSTGVGTIALDMWETPDHVVVQALVPGVAPQDMDISIVADTLTIKGEVKSERKEEGNNYHYQERRYGAFSRSVPLPSSIDAERVEAKYEHGVLTLTMPKAEAARPRHIKVTAK